MTTQKQQTDSAAAALQSLLSLDPSAAVAEAQVLAAVTGDDAVLRAAQSAARAPEAAGLRSSTDANNGLTPEVGLDAAPNPSAGRVSLALVIESAARVRLAVYDALGREVAVVHEGPLGRGTHRVRFDGTSLPSGVYVAHAAVSSEGGTRALVRRFTLAR